MRHLTESVVSLLAEYDSRIHQNKISLKKAQIEAAGQIRTLRYGLKGSHYFWICDMSSRLIMHPFRPEMEGKRVAGLMDAKGNTPFGVLAETVKKHGQGYIDYWWPRNEQTREAELKLSFVQGFAPWGWIIGTGIHHKEVLREVQLIIHRFLKIFGGVFLFLICLSFYITRQTIHIAKQKMEAEQARRLEEAGTKKLLRLTQKKEASPDSIITFALKEVVGLSRSELGYFALWDSDDSRMRVYLWPGQPRNADAGWIKFSLDDIKPWALPLISGKPLTINHPIDGPPKQDGMVRAPVSINRFLGIPVLEQNRIVALAGLANKKQVYGSADIRHLQLMMEGMWKILVNIKAQKELKKSEEQYRLLADNASDVIWILQMSTLRSSYISPSIQQLLGYSPENFLNLPMEAHLSEASMRKVYQVIPETQEQTFPPGVMEGRYRVLELEMIKKGGSRIWTEVTASLLRNENGIPDRILGIIRDISHRKALEEELLESNRALCLAQRIAKIGSWSMDPEKGLGKWSDEVFLIYERDMELGTPSLEEHFRIYSFQHQAKLESALKEAVSNGTPFDVETVLTLPSTKEKWVNIICNPQPDPNSSGYFLSGTIQDISERKNMELRMQQSQKMEAIGTFAGGIAHDFNNILSAMMGFTELAKLRLKNDSEITKKLDHVLSGGMRARELVKHILTFSRKTNVQKRTVRVAPLIKESLKFLKASTLKNIEVRRQISDETCTVFADPTQIHQVLMNLFANAVQAMEKTGGCLKVSMEAVNLSRKDSLCREIHPGQYVQIMISDTGCGIPSHIIEKIFEPFFTTKKRGEGTGMGLSTVYGIIKSLEGAIRVHSRPGKGTRFQIFIPKQKANAEPDRVDQTIPAVAGRSRLLLVDDEAPILEWMSQLLSIFGYQIMTAPGGEEALEIFRQNAQEIDMVLTDLSMPGMNGLCLAEKIKMIRPGIPILLCTGFLEGITQKRIVGSGISDIIIKPVITGELVRAIENILEDKKL